MGIYLTPTAYQLKANTALGGLSENMDGGLPWQPISSDSVLSLPGPASVLGWGTKILQTSWCSKNKK